MLYRPAKTFLRHRDKQTTSARMQSGRLLHTKFAGHVVVKQNIRGSYRGEASRVGASSTGHWRFALPKTMQPEAETRRQKKHTQKAHIFAHLPDQMWQAAPPF